MADNLLANLFGGGGNLTVPAGDDIDTGFNFGELTKDRNFLSLLAGVGSRLGAGGVGEAIGVPTQQLLQSVGAQEATAKSALTRKSFNEQLMQLLGGLSPKETPGPTSIKATPGNLSLDITPPGGAPTGTAPGTAGVTPEAQTPSSVTKLSDIIPFL